MPKLSAAIQSCLYKDALSKSALVVSGLLIAVTPPGADAKPKPYTSYYRDATVYRDRNNNSMIDGAEGKKARTTAADGSFKPPPGNGALTLEGGIDITTGQPNQAVLKAPPNTRAVSVLTALWQELLSRKVPKKKIRLLLTNSAKGATVTDFQAVPPSKASRKAQSLLTRDAQFNVLSSFITGLSQGAITTANAPAKRKAHAEGEGDSGKTISALVDALLGLGQPQVNLADAAAVQALLGPALGSLGVSLTAQQLQTVSMAAAQINASITLDNLPAAQQITANASLTLEAGDFASFAQHFTGESLSQQFSGRPLFVYVPPPQNLALSNSTANGQPITNNPAPILTGTADSAVTQVSIARDGAAQMSVPVVNGAWSYTSPSLADGSYLFSVAGIDAAGNASDARTLSVTVDTTPPPAPSVNPQALTLATPSPSLSGTWSAAPGNRLSITVNNQTFVPVTSGTAWSLALNPIPPAGAYDVLARETDPAGNSSDDPTAQELTVNLPVSIVRVSVASDGTQGNKPSGSYQPNTNDGRFAGLSADGRFVAFQSAADNLVDQDQNLKPDIFQRDTQTGKTTRVSVASDGTEANGYSGGRNSPALSADGQIVAFRSKADNLAPNDTLGFADIFLRDPKGGVTRASVASDGSEGVGNSYFPSISADGRYVAFESTANNLVASNNGIRRHIYLRDARTRLTTQVTVASDGTPGYGYSFAPALSADGRFVAFLSASTHLVAGQSDTNGVDDIFVRDNQTSAVSRVSVASDGAEANGPSGINPAISADGRFVVFGSSASNLAPPGADANGAMDIFLRDTQRNTTELVSVALDGGAGNSLSYTPSISADGRYVVFQSRASNLVAGDTNQFDDIFLRDRQAQATFRVSVRSDGVQADYFSYSPAISADGRFVAFASAAANLLPAGADTNGVRDVFVASGGWPIGLAITSVTTGSGLSLIGGLTNDNTPTLAGTADSGTVSVNIYANDLTQVLLIGNAPVIANGWSFTYTGQLGQASDGDYIVTVKGVNAQGQESAPSPEFNVTIDATLPAAAKADAQTTSNTTPTLTGTWSGEQGALLEITVDGKVYGIAEGLVTTATDWSLTLTTPLAIGTYDLIATTTDAAYNQRTDTFSGALIIQ